MKPDGTLLLSRSEVAALLNLNECMAAVEQAFRLYAEGKIAPPGILGLHTTEGGFHIKAGLLKLGRSYFALKVNANFPQNVKRFDLPLIQGVIVLCEGEHGRPLAVLDSMEITVLRTGAATGVAANYLARPDAKVATVCGCGNQGRVSLRALAGVRALTLAYAFDCDEEQARRFAAEVSEELDIEVRAVNELARAVKESDVCVTCTPSKQYLVSREDVRPGTFIAAVGADNGEKQEIDPRLMASGKVVADLLEQCATIGDLHHAINQGLMTKASVHAELGEVIAGMKPGRTSDDEVIIFDSTGTALQDVAAAAIVYERAVPAGAGAIVRFGQ